MKIAIASGKGGTGKTTVSTNLAALLADSQDVVLVDLDVEEPNSGLFIQGKYQVEEEKYKTIPSWKDSNCSLCGGCQKICNFHAIIFLGSQVIVFPELCHSCYACSELCPTNSLPMVQARIGVTKFSKMENLCFVESRLDIGQEQAVPLISQTINQLNKKYQEKTIKILDSPPGTSCPVIEVVKNSDFVILVTEPTPFGLNDLKLAVETVKKLNKDFAVVINRYGIGNEDTVDYCNKNDINVIARIPNNRMVAEMYSKGDLIYNEIPEFKRELKKIIEYIMILKVN